MSQRPIKPSSMSRVLLRWTAWAWVLMFLEIACGAPLPAGNAHGPAALDPRNLTGDGAHSS